MEVHSFHHRSGWQPVPRADSCVVVSQLLCLLHFHCSFICRVCQDTPSVKFPPTKAGQFNMSSKTFHSPSILRTAGGPSGPDTHFELDSIKLEGPLRILKSTQVRCSKKKVQKIQKKINCLSGIQRGEWNFSRPRQRGRADVERLLDQTNTGTFDNFGQVLLILWSGQSLCHQHISTCPERHCRTKLCLPDGSVRA